MGRGVWAQQAILICQLSCFGSNEDHGSSLLFNPLKWWVFRWINDLIETIHQTIRGEIVYGLSVTAILRDLASYVVVKPGLASRDSVKLVQTCLEESDIGNAHMALHETGAIRTIRKYAGSAPGNCKGMDKLQLR
jgi:hypothetical protein